MENPLYKHVTVKVLTLQMFMISLQPDQLQNKARLQCPKLCSNSH